MGAKEETLPARRAAEAHLAVMKRISKRVGRMRGIVYTEKNPAQEQREETMPVVNESSYISPVWLRNGHLQTIWPVLFRNPSLPALWRERLETPDGDFVDVDHIPACAGIRSNRVAILSHGLEGDSRRRYMLGMAKALNRRGWDVVARNFRGCSGEPNRKASLYHSGETDDLHLVVEHCVALGYLHIVLVGFSMGGNQTLKYLGERERTIPAQVCAAVAVSVPCDLEGAAHVLAQPSRAPYMAYFLRTLRLKIESKHARFPDLIDIRGLKHVRSFLEFDTRYTAPLHGFTSARHYWRESGCLRLLENIDVPFLLINAADDPFLSEECYPLRVAEANKAMTLEMPHWGGHVGFVSPGHELYWSEKRAADFLGTVYDGMNGTFH